MADSTQKTHRGVRVLRIAFWIILLFLVLYQTLFEVRSGRLRVRKELKSHVGLCVQRWEKRRGDFEFALIALVEQRAVREGFARLRSERSITLWSQGFLEALDGAVRSIMVSNPGVENLTFRSLEGVKSAGSGADRDSVAYPDHRIRLMRREIRRESDQPMERIVVPVRAADASPIAFLTAEIGIKGFWKAIFTEFESRSDLLLLLADGSGRRIVSNKDDLVFPTAQPDLRKFEYNGKAFLVESAALPGTDQKLYAALPRDAETAVSFAYFVGNIVLVAVIILLLWSYKTAVFRKKPSPEAEKVE